MDEGPAKDLQSCVCVKSKAAGGASLTVGPACSPPSQALPVGWEAAGWAGGGGARARTVKMLERRLDCLRMGVGVEEAAMVSMRSSRWLMLGVEGTEDE